MTGRLLLDENVEREVAERLEGRGYDVAHVESRARLRGASDEAIGAYAREHDHVLVTYDDDFVTASGAVLYLPDESMAVDHVVAILDEILTQYPASEIEGLVYASSAWIE
jgi:hypothetical protein